MISNLEYLIYNVVGMMKYFIYYVEMLLIYVLSALKNKHNCEENFSTADRIIIMSTNKPEYIN